MISDNNHNCTCKSDEKCCDCHDAEETAFDPEEIYELGSTTLEKVFHYIRSPRFFGEIEKAEQLYFNYGDDEELDKSLVHPMDYNNFSVWFICDYKLEKEGMTPIQLFMEEKPDALSGEEKTMAERLAASFLSVYDVVAVDDEDGSATLRNLFNFQAEKVYDSAVVQLAGKNVFFALRLIDWENYVFSGGDIYIYHGEFKERFLMFLKNKLIDPRALVPKSIIDLLKTKGYLFNHLQQSMRKDVPIRKKNNFEEEEEPHEEETVEKKPIKEKEIQASISRAHFLVENYEKIRSFLESNIQIKVLEEKESGITFSWARNPGRSLTHNEDGIIRLSKRKLVFESMDASDFEDGKTFIRKNLKGQVDYMYDDLEKRRGFATDN